MDINWTELCTEIKRKTDKYEQEEQRKIDERNKWINSLYEEAAAIINKIPSLLQRSIDFGHSFVELYENKDIDSEERSGIIARRIKYLLEQNGVKCDLDEESTDYEYDTNYVTYRITVDISELVKLTRRFLK
jgi:hypothetical protein